jgi:biopolymer transport protein ExbD
LAIKIIPTFLISVWAEHKFRIIQRLKKLLNHILNRPVKISITLTLNGKKTAKDIGETIGNLWKETYSVKVITDSKNDYSVSNNEYTIDIHNLPDNEIGIKTSNLETPIIEVENKFSEIMEVLDKIKDVSIENLSLTASLPYKFEFVEIKTCAGISVENYDIMLTKDKWKSKLSLTLKNKRQEIMVNGETRAEMQDILRSIFKLI